MEDLAENAILQRELRKHHLDDIENAHINRRFFTLRLNSRRILSRKGKNRGPLISALDWNSKERKNVDLDALTTMWPDVENLEEGAILQPNPRKDHLDE